jgi:hypothetical protein
MREILEPHPSLFHILPRNEIGRELEANSRIIDANRAILDKEGTKLPRRAR